MECNYCKYKFKDNEDYFEFENETYCEECFDDNVKDCFRKTFYEREEG